MARNRRQQAQTAPAAPAGSDTIHVDENAEQPGGEFGTLPMPMAMEVGGSRVVGSAVSKDPPPLVKQYRVVRGGSVMYSGCRSSIHTGKIFPETAYDIAVLTKQGIVLEDITVYPKPAEPETEDDSGEETEEV